MGKRAVTWAVVGGAFVAISLSSGCGSPRSITWNSSPVAKAPTPLAGPKVKAAGEQVAQPPVSAPTPEASGSTAAAIPGPAGEPPQQVNIFGEFDGLERKGLVLTGQSNIQQHTFLSEGYDADVSLDRAGKWMLFTSTRHSEHPEIYVQKVDGLSVTQLTNDQSDEANPVFSPDGQKIAFSSNRSGTWDIYVMDADGRNMVQVTNGPMQDLHPTFSPDGTMLCYASLGSRSDQWELWTVSLESLEKRMIGYGLYPAWSSDQRVSRIAFQRARQRGSRWFSLWTLDLIEGEARRVTEVAVSTNAAILKPSWSPDGTKLAFTTVVEPAQAAKGKPSGQQDIWIINADGTDRRRLTDGLAANLMPCWAVDNRVYFISDRSGSESIWSVRLDMQPSRVATGDTSEVTD